MIDLTSLCGHRRPAAVRRSRHGMTTPSPLKQGNPGCGRLLAGLGVTTTGRVMRRETKSSNVLSHQL